MTTPASLTYALVREEQNEKKELREQNKQGMYPSPKVPGIYTHTHTHSPILGSTQEVAPHAPIAIVFGPL